MKKTYISPFIALIVLVLCSVRLSAQIINCNVFIQGQSLEVGIAPNGAYGTSEYAPTTYHANVADSMYNSCTSSLTVTKELGFIADPNRTAWSSFYGDYVLPGLMAREGFAMEDSTGSATAYSSNYHAGFSGFTGALSGSNTAYWISGTTKRGEWIGTFGADSITVDQTAIVDTAGLYLDMHIEFSNMHSSATDTFYYLRTVNPHNEAAITSNLNTKIKVEYQLPNSSNLTVLSAAGLTHPDAYMEIGTADTRARGFIITDSTLPVSGDLASIYNGDPTNYQYSDSVTGNYGMGLVFRFILGPGASTSIDFGYSFKGGVIDSVLGDTTIVSSLKLNNPATTRTISVYPNPSNNVVNVSGSNIGETIYLYDVIGRVVSQSVCSAQGLNTVSIGTLPSGIYILAVKDNSGNIVSRIRVLKN